MPLPALGAIGSTLLAGGKAAGGAIGKGALSAGKAGLNKFGALSMQELLDEILGSNSNPAAASIGVPPVQNAIPSLDQFQGLNTRVGGGVR